MSMKHRFFIPILTFSLKIIEAVSDEGVENFHQDISQVEMKYSRKWGPNMLADYCWRHQLANIRGKKREVSVEGPYFLVVRMLYVEILFII